MRSLTALVLAAAIGSPALAQRTVVDGNTLDDSCRYKRMLDSGVVLSDEQSGRMAFCIGYVRGVLDELWSEQAMPDILDIKKSGHSKICISDDVSNEQMLKVVIKYLQGHPSKLQVPANLLIRSSMEEAFPCKAP